MSRQKLLVVNPLSELKEFIFQELEKLDVSFFVLVERDYPKFIERYCDTNHLIHTNSFSSSDMITSIIKFSLENDEFFNGIITFNEGDVVETSIVAEYFCWKTISSKSAIHSSSNKYLMRHLCKLKKIPMPKFKVFETYDEGVSKYMQFNGPTVIKPINRASSEGVIKIDKVRKVRAFKKAYKTAVSSLACDPARIPTYLIESYVPGTVVSVDGAVNNNGIYIWSVSDFEMSREPDFFQTNCFIPGNLPQVMKKKCIAITKDVVKALNFNNCGFHCELRVSPEKIYFLEIAARCGGGYVALQIKETYGINVIKVLTDIALNNPIHFKRRIPKLVTTNYRLAIPGKGVIKDISGISECRNHPNIFRIAQLVNENDVIPKENMYAIAGFCLVGKKRDDIRKTIGWISNTIAYQIVKPPKPPWFLILVKKIIRRIFKQLNFVF